MFPKFSTKKMDSSQVRVQKKDSRRVQTQSQRLESSPSPAKRTRGESKSQFFGLVPALLPARKNKVYSELRSLISRYTEDMKLSFQLGITFSNSSEDQLRGIVDIDETLMTPPW